MDTQKLYQWLKTLPLWLRAIVLVLISCLVLIASTSLSACGTMTSATIRNIQPNTNTAINITSNTHNETEVNTSATPSVSLPNLGK